MGIRIRRQTTKSSCQTTMAMKSDGDGRCDSIFVHIELLISVPHWHIDYWHIDFCKTMQKVMCRWSQNKMETKESDDKHQLVMSNEASKNNHDGRCKSFFLCRTLILAPHSHIDFLYFLGKVNGEHK